MKIRKKCGIVTHKPVINSNVNISSNSVSYIAYVSNFYVWFL